MAKPAAKAKKPVPAASLKQMFRDVPYMPERVPDPATDLKRRQDLLRLLWLQGLVAVGLFFVLLLGAPFFKPQYQYFALTEDNKVVGQLDPLDMPNLTDEAIIAWAATSVTALLTFGFGDIEQKLDLQLWRFTDEGRFSFVKAIATEDLLTKVRADQLVLTTVPRDVPIITLQGENEFKEQFWVVQVPVIMTYVTNDNFSQPQKQVIELEIVRVPTWRNPQGIAIKSLKLAAS